MVTKMATNSFKFFPVLGSQDALCLKSVYRNTLVPFEQISHFHTKWSAYNGDVWTPSGCLRSSFQYLHSHSQFLRFRESNQMKSIEQGAMRGFDRPKAWSSTSKRGTASILRNLKSTLIRCEWTCDLVWGDQITDQWPVRGAVCSVYDNHGGHNGHCPHGQRSNETGKWNGFHRIFSQHRLCFSCYSWAYN